MNYINLSNPDLQSTVLPLFTPLVQPEALDDFSVSVASRESFKVHKGKVKIPEICMLLAPEGIIFR